MKNLHSSRQRLLISSAIIAIGCFPAGIKTADAASFYLQEQSVSAMGTAFAGASAYARDASIINYNAAGMTDLTGAEIYFSNQILISRMDMENNGSTLFGAASGGTNSDDATPTIYLPSLYAAMPVYDDVLWLGIGLTVPFGLVTEYDDSWYGRYDAIKSKLMTYDIQPSIAYEVTDWLSIGGGVNIQYAEARLSNAVHNGATEGLATLKGTDWTVGFNAGALIKPTSSTTVGVSYRQGMTQDLEGSVTVEGVAGLNEHSNASAALDLPDVIELGVAQKLDDRWTLLGQANYIDWDVLQDIVALRDDGTVISTITHDHHSTWAFSAGAEYKATDKLALRLGYQYDPTPTNDENRTASIPDGDRNMIAGGFTYDITDAAAIDFSANYATLSDEKISIQRNSNLANINLERDDTSYSFVGIGLKYKFPATARSR